jgi:hypothetical protein
MADVLSQIEDLKEKIKDKAYTSEGLLALESIGESDYTDSEFGLINSLGNLFTDGGPSQDSQETYLDAFDRIAKQEVWDSRENLTTEKANWFRRADGSVKALFSQSEITFIENEIISQGLNGAGDSVVPTNFVESIGTFDREVCKILNELLSEEARVSDCPVIEQQGLRRTFPASTDDKSILNSVYTKLRNEEDDFVPPIKFMEVEVSEGKVRKNEIIQSISSVSSIQINDPLKAGFWNDTWQSFWQIFPEDSVGYANAEKYNDEVVNGEAFLTTAYREYISALVGDFSLSDAGSSQTSKQIFKSHVQSLAEKLAPPERRYLVTYRRKARWEAMASIFGNLTEEDLEGLTDEELGNLIGEALDEAQLLLNESLETMGIGAEADPEEEIDLAERLKFWEQCALLSNIGTLPKQYREKKLKDNLYYDSSTGAARIYLVDNKSGDTASNINKLLLSKGDDIKTFLEITPDVAAMLIPKIRLFSVEGSGNNIKKKEFIFPNHTPASIETIFQGGGITKGTDYGIKSFSFAFEGTTPATARKDITATLTLFFQDFEDFVKDRGEDPRFVDLIMFDKSTTSEQYGFNSANKFQYNPAHFRILAEVGWQIPKDEKIKQEINKRVGMDYDSLKNALQKTNRSFYLNMVEHHMDFRKDGTFEIRADYQAYLESALKGPEFDALANTEIIKRRAERDSQLLQLIEDDVCNVEGYAQLTRAFEAEDQLLAKTSYQSILDRMLCYNFLHFAIPDESSISFFRRNGYFQIPCPLRDNTLLSDGSTTTNLNAEMVNREKKTTAYFFFGDLIYTILDCVYDKENPFNSPINNVKFLFFPFEVQDFNGSTVKLNIADIPISVDFYIEWYTENVIAPKRTSYPVLFFIRDLANKLITELLGEVCRYKPLESKISFKTGNITVKRKDRKDPISTVTDNGKSTLDIETQYANGDVIPMITDDGIDSDMSEYINYILVFPAYSNIQHVGLGDLSGDQNRGVYHFDIGADRGLVKTMKFSKVDMQYVREARFFQQGAQGLSQLQSVYSVDIEMLGNTLYYPGMEIYINPRGLGGSLGSPSKKGSVANTLGFGGYHMITRVDSRLTPSTFSTNIKAMFTYAGDGGSPAYNFVSPNNAAEGSMIENPDPSQISAECNYAIDISEHNAAKINASGSSAYGNLTDFVKSNADRKASEVAKSKILNKMSAEQRAAWEARQKSSIEEE